MAAAALMQTGGFAPDGGETDTKMPLPRLTTEGAAICFLEEPAVLLAWSHYATSPGRALDIWCTEDWRLEQKISFRSRGFYNVDVRPNSTVAVTIEDRPRSREQFIVTIPEGTTDRSEFPSPRYVYSPNGLLRAYRPLGVDGWPNGTRIIVEEVRSGQALVDFTPFRLDSRILGFSPDSRFLLFDGANYRPSKGSDVNVPRHSENEPPFRLWDVRSRCEDARRIAGKRTDQFVSFTPDGKQLVAIGSREVFVSHFATGRIVAKTSFRGRVRSAALSNDGTLVAFSTPTDITLWEPSTGVAVSWAWEQPGGISLVLFSPDGRWLVTNQYFGRNWFVWCVEDLLAVMSREEADTER
jgi:hypothetical protein